MKRYILYLFLLIHLLHVPAYPQKKGTIWGIVRSDKENLVGVNIVIKNIYLGTTTDNKGYYKLQLPPGNYIAQFRMIGFAIVEDTILVNANQQIEHNVTLQDVPIEYSGVTVEAKRYKKKPLFKSYLVSVPRVKNAPPLGEPDVFNAVSNLPGVVKYNDLKGSLHFRGGGSDQNLILLDGVEIYNPYHLLGLFGIFNIQTLENAEIFIGDFPVKYGDRISSVIDLKSVNSHRKTITNVSLLSSSITLADKWKEIFYLFAARRTYFDLLIPKLPYNFTDLNFKASANLSNNFNIGITGFYDKDHLTPEGENQSKSSCNWGNTMGAVRLSWYNRYQMSSFLISYEKNFVDFTYDPIIDNKIHDLSFKSSTLFNFHKHNFEFGLSHKLLRFDYSWDGNVNDLKEIFHEGTPEQFRYDNRNNLLSAYFSDKITINKKNMLECGIRYNRWRQSDFYSPRISSLWKLKPNIEAKFSIGRYYQMLAYGSEAIEGSVGSLLFPIIQPISAAVLSFGLNVGLPWKMNFEIEMYQKFLKKVPRFGSSFPDFELGRGKIRGLDCFLTKDKGDLTFQFTYSYLNTEANFAGDTYPFDWDVTHVFHGLTGYKIRKGWFVNYSITFRSGVPITPVVGKFLRVRNIDPDQPYSTNREEYLEGEKNSLRLPYYFRTDVSLRKKFFKKDYNYTIYLQIINLFNNKNPLRYEWDKYYNNYSYDYEGKRKSTGGVNSLPIIPSLGVEFEF
jgi:hypothetical protein